MGSLTTAKPYLDLIYDLIHDLIHCRIHRPSLLLTRVNFCYSRSGMDVNGRGLIDDQ